MPTKAELEEQVAALQEANVQLQAGQILDQASVNSLQIRAETWGEARQPPVEGDLTIHLYNHPNKGMTVVALWDDGRATATPVADTDTARQVMADIRHPQEQ